MFFSCPGSEGEGFAASMDIEMMDRADIGDAPRPPRRRQPAEIRIRQILDAALAEFSNHGFAAARMDDIAIRAGLSKGSLYFHFKSKEHLLETLLCQFLTPFPLAAPVAAGQPVTVNLFVDLLADRAFRQLNSEPAIKAMRLLIAEGPRVSMAVAQWHRHLRENIEPALHGLVAAGIAQGTLKPGTATEQPWLLFSPILMTVMQGLIHDGSMKTPEEWEQDRQSYAALLRELLTPSP